MDVAGFLKNIYTNYYISITGRSLFIPFQQRSCLTMIHLNIDLLKITRLYEKNYTPLNIFYSNNFTPVHKCTG